jgi:murein DD-endopeptidase MepM/ murein hydrolase activator NlpD
MDVNTHLKYRGVAVALDDTVETGQLLGYSGASGDVEEPHLHFAAVRTVKNSAGWQEEISVPVKFYVGVPPVAFSPRAGLIVTANYSGNAEVPWAPSEAPLSRGWRPTLEPGEESRAWSQLALWLAAGVAGLAWYWKFFASK